MLLLISLNEHDDPHFLFYKFNENNILNNWEKIGRNLWLLFWQMKINATERDITGPTEQVQIMFHLKDKKCTVFEDNFFVT